MREHAAASSDARQLDSAPQAGRPAGSYGAAPMALPSGLYEPAGAGRYRATALTRGPWSPEHQHAGPATALLAHTIEAAAGIDGGHVARITVDILRPIPVDGVVRCEARLLRPGRRVEQLEATMTAGPAGTELMRARAWRMRTEAVQLPPGLALAGPPPGPDGLASVERPSFWTTDITYFDALEWRFAHGDFERPGPAAAWTRLRVPLIAGARTTPLEHLLVMADAASGVSSELDWTAYSFANVDFSVVLQRPPQGEWMAMDARTHIGGHGAGVCVGELADWRGHVGTSTQALFVAAG
jgi:hypothetical protein